ncbi:hypothetical protein J4E91_005685 [Alternaria rosae]|nr:hypothetical protein J4E91_005685 [Alternaria rosae]
MHFNLILMSSHNNITTTYTSANRPRLNSVNIAHTFDSIVPPERMTTMEHLDAKAKDRFSHKVKAKVGSTAKSALAKTKEKLAESKAKKEAKKAEKEEGRRRIDSVVA